MAAFALLILGATRLVSWQQDRLQRKIQQWPMTEATIEGGTFQTIQGSNNPRTPLKAPVLSFSYHAGGDYYSGRVALMEFFDDEGAEIIQRMTLKKLEIYYDPEDSARWYFDDDRIAGCRIRQEGLQSESGRSF
jgi:hypothetical protein